MAKILVLFFPDDADADAIVNGGDGSFFFTKEERREISTLVIGEYKYPTKWCECTISQFDQEHSHIFGRGKKYGWWVHTGTKSKPGCGFAANRYQHPRNLIFPTGLIPRGSQTHTFNVSPATVQPTDVGLGLSQEKRLT